MTVNGLGLEFSMWSGARARRPRDSRRDAGATLEFVPEARVRQAPTALRLRLLRLRPRVLRLAGAQ